MTLYVGHTITVRAQATDAIDTTEIITTADATVEFYAPGKKPASVPADRTPDVTVAMSYDVDSTSYLVYQNTDGWVAGKWSYRVVLTGSHDTWQYGSFTLKA